MAGNYQEKNCELSHSNSNKDFVKVTTPGFKVLKEDEFKSVLKLRLNKFTLPAKPKVDEMNEHKFIVPTNKIRFSLETYRTRKQFEVLMNKKDVSRSSDMSSGDPSSVSPPHVTMTTEHQHRYRSTSPPPKQYKKMFQVCDIMLRSFIGTVCVPK